MEQIAAIRPRCSALRRAMCLAALAVGAGGLARAIATFTPGGHHAHSSSNGAELLTVMIGPLCAAAVGSRRPEPRRCTRLSRKRDPSPGARRRPRHER
jgi:hypothetical protein